MFLLSRADIYLLLFRILFYLTLLPVFCPPVIGVEWGSSSFANIMCVDCSPTQKFFNGISTWSFLSQHLVIFINSCYRYFRIGFVSLSATPLLCQDSTTLPSYAFVQHWYGMLHMLPVLLYQVKIQYL